MSGRIQGLFNPAYRATLLYFYLVTHADVLGKGKKLVER